jgi:aspartate/methionine/tyrosine aminotransferase
LRVAYPLFLAKLLIHSGLARFVPWVQRLTEGGVSFLPYYSDGLLTAPHTELCEVLALRQPPASDIIDLASAAPHFDLVPSRSTKLPADRRDAPPVGGLAELKTAVAEKLCTDHHLTLQPAGEVLITAGVAGAFNLALDALVNRGDRVVLFGPASPLYRFALRQRGIRIRWVPTRQENGLLRFDAMHLIEALRGARMVVVNAPLNPTGGVFVAADFEQIAWWADRRDVLIFSDEAFERYRFEGEALSIGAMPRACGRTLTAGSVSQSHALGSARVGWLAAQRHLLRPCLLTAVLQSASVPTLCQQIALSALRLGDEAFASIRADFDSRRRYTFERLQALGLKPDWPAGGFYLWVPVQELGLSGQQFAEQLLRTKKVRVWPGHHFGPSGGGHIRISYAAEDGRLRQGLARLGDFVGQLQATGRPAVQKWAA